MIIAVLSGKGGTGKSTVTANLAHTLSRNMETIAVDCDVEEPNLHLFFPGKSKDEDVQVPVPVVDPGLCNLCGACARFCRFGALVMGLQGPALNPQMCHSCGGCVLVCPRDAISETGRSVGVIRTSIPQPGLTLVTGVLNEGEVRAPPVIKRAKESLLQDCTAVLDSSPGIACPVIETLDEADVAILVTESTPFGLHDLELAADVVQRMGIPAGVVINRSDGQDADVVAFCRHRSLPVLMTIPFDRNIAKVQNQGGLICRSDESWMELFLSLYHRTEALLGGGT